MEEWELEEGSTKSQKIGSQGLWEHLSECACHSNTGTRVLFLTPWQKPGHGIKPCDPRAGEETRRFLGLTGRQKTI